MDFTLDQLRALDAIDRGGSFAAAARELHRVPSAVTYLVRNLEATLGLSLFERTGRGAVLTAEGRQVLEHARDVLARARALDVAARDLAGGWEAELRVVVDGALPMQPLTACLVRFARPDVPTRLRIDVEYQEGVLERMQRDDADIGLYLGFDTDAQAVGWERTALPSLQVVLVAAADHPLATGPCDDTARAAFAELVVRDSAERFAAQPKPSFMGSRNVVMMSDFHAKRVALLAGAGFGWVPRHLITDDLSARRLALLDVDQNTWTYRPVRITALDRSLGRAARVFLETLDDAVSGIQNF